MENKKIRFTWMNKKYIQGSLSEKQFIQIYKGFYNEGSGENYCK